jgi:DNA polymerase-3 subunit alpha
MNPSRVTNADIDTDYSKNDRIKVKEFLLKDRMGLDNIRTSEIITFNTIALKGAIRDVCRALYSNEDYLQIANTVCENVDINEEQTRKAYPELFEYVDIVNGTIVSIGSHPSGVLVSDKNIEEDIGMCSLSTSPYPVSMLNMKELDALMYVKLDILGLDNIGLINDTCKMLGIERFTPDNVDLDDERVWKSIRDDTTLIFQWESDSAQSYLKRFMSDKTLEIAKAHNKNFSYIKWFSFGNGLIRPGCASFRDDVANGDIIITGFKELDEFLAITFGRVTMQEDIMQFLVKFCGYSDAESDTVRRGIAKKYGTETFIDEIHNRFIDYSNKTYHIDKEKLEEIFPPIKQGILDASSYAFSWNHSDSYSCIGYICGYLRYYYPLEFLTVALNTFVDNEEKSTKIVEYCNKVGISIRPIKFRHSKDTYTPDKEHNAIYKGVSSVKFLNADVAQKMYEMREQNFSSFIDFLKINPCNSKQTEILIKLGFFSEFGKSQKLLDICDIFSKYGGKKQIKKENLALDENIVLRYGTATEKMYKITDNDGLLNELCNSIIEDKETPITDKISAEKEYLGYISYINPKAPDSLYYVSEMKIYKDKCKPYVTLYQLKTGKIIKSKVYKADEYAISPFKENSILNIWLDDKCKSKLVNGKWVKTNEKEKVMSHWEIVKN